MHMTRTTTCLLTALLAALPAFAQQHDNQNRDMNCDNNWRNNNDRASHCEIQEQTVAFVPKLLAMVLAVGFALPWILTRLVEYSHDLIANIPNSM